MNNIPPDVIYIYTVYNLKSIGKTFDFFIKNLLSYSTSFLH